MDIEISAAVLWQKNSKGEIQNLILKVCIIDYIECIGYSRYNRI